MLVCQYCQRTTTNPGANKKHEISCGKNPNSRKCGGNPKGFIPWNKGIPLPYEVGTKGKPGTFRGKKHSNCSKEQMAQKKKELYASGWECKAGRCKKYDYNSPTAGQIKVDGSWELKFCVWADSKHLEWKRNKQRFAYIKPDGKSSTYQPDFYVKELDAYIEVKGYETDLDKCKWSQFSDKLLIIRRNEIGELDEWFKSVSC